MKVIIHFPDGNWGLAAIIRILVGFSPLTSGFEIHGKVGRSLCRGHSGQMRLPHGGGPGIWHSPETSGIRLKSGAWDGPEREAEDARDSATS